MSTHPNAPAGAGRPRPRYAGTVARVGLIGVILAALAGAFAYLGGWFTPDDLTPARFTDAFEQIDGVHPGFRRNHAKGVGVSGVFDGNGQGARLSKAVVFRPGRVPVVGRFSLTGGDPYVADMPDTVRGLGLQFSPPDGETWRTAMINLPVFPVRTPEAFYERMVASEPDPATGKPDPARMNAFLARHPETAQAALVLKGRPVSSGFENSTFHGLNAFRFTNSAGDSTPVRWLMTPAQPFEAATAGAAPRDKKYLFDALIAKINRQPLRWHLVVVIGQPGDPTADATMAWPDEREKVDVGTLTLDRVESEETSAATGINFDPLVLPAGMAPSDDPFLSARSAVYSRSFTRRAGEMKPPSAVTPADVEKGK
ncbi:MAG: catalase [Gemmataceae bacterium]|nr:catalase [Gemmataceae bacterium]